MPQGLAPVSGVFPAGGYFTFWNWGSGNLAFSHITRVFRNAPPRTPGHGRWFPG